MRAFHAARFNSPDPSTTCVVLLRIAATIGQRKNPSNPKVDCKERNIHGHPCVVVAVINFTRGIIDCGTPN